MTLCTDNFGQSGTSVNLGPTVIYTLKAIQRQPTFDDVIDIKIESTLYLYTRMSKFDSKISKALSHFSSSHKFVAQD
jgi:hypothetical protein